MFPVRAAKRWRRTETVEQGYKAMGDSIDSIDNMGNVIAFSLRFLMWGREDGGDREIRGKASGVCKGSS